MIAKLFRKIAGAPTQAVPERVEPKLSDREELIRKAIEIQSEKQKIFDALDDKTKLKLMAQLMQPTAGGGGKRATGKPAARKPAGR